MSALIKQGINTIDLEARKQGIGGSDIASVLGINPYKSAYELYEEKVNGISIDLSDNEKVVWGNLLEEPIAKRYEQVTSKNVDITATIINPNYPFLIANPDRLIIDEKRGLEIKAVGEHTKHLWGEPGSQLIPDYYYAQVAHYMLVLDYYAWDVAALIGGQELRIYSFERDNEMDEIILDGASDFWNNHVLKKNPPIIEYSNPNAKELIKRKFNLVSEECVELPDELVEVTNQYEEAKRLISQYQKLKDESETRILEKIGNAGKAYLKDGRTFIRKLVERKPYTVPPSQYISLNLKKGV